MLLVEEIELTLSFQTLEKCLKGETEDETVTKLVEFY